METYTPEQKQRFEQLSKNPSLTIAINDLLQSFVYSKFLLIRKDIDFKILQKAGWICSALAESHYEDHKKLAQFFAILLHLYGNGSQQYDKLSYVILSRLGNLLSTKFLLSLFVDNRNSLNNFKYEFGQLLNLELSNERLERIINVNHNYILTTDFQLDLWNKLSNNKNISISAPTSAGKSFIIQNFIKDLYSTTDSAQGLYIVPTKALINQASDDLRKILSGTSIKTSFIENELLTNGLNNITKPESKIIYILTPERCLKLLENIQNISFYPNIIFVDEIQNVEDTQGRGALLEFVLESIASAFPLSKIITAGPFINNEEEVFEELFQSTAVSCTTELPPVFQLQTIVRNTSYDNNLELFVYNTFDDNKFKINIPVDFNLNYELDKSKGVAIAKTILALLGPSQQKSQSIVYCPQTNYAEPWALRMEELLPETKDQTDEMKELIEFISSEIHPKYYLIKCLKKSIAFHHSKLPDIVRKEIEDLFKQGEISTIYCTSTLLQGVNLPAQNLFITSPRKRNIKLTSFEFGNLIGRAGRIKDSLYGIVYCIEGRDEEKQWAESFYNKSFKKDIIPATRKALQNSNEIIDNLDKTSVELREDHISTTITNLRHHYISSPDSFNKYLETKKLNQEDILRLISPLSERLNNIVIPNDLLKLNPNIDPLLQNELYKSIIFDGIEEWVIIPNSNFNRAIGKDYVDNFSRSELSFYWQFTILCEKLDQIFKFNSEAYFKHGISLSLRQMSFSAFQWLRNIPLKDIIMDDIKFYSEKIKQIDPNSESDINYRINQVITIQSKIVTFLLVKYFKLLSDLLRSIMNVESSEKYKFTLSLPTMLELGSSEPIIIQLITAGITRTVALQIFNEFKKVPNFREIDVLAWIETRSNVANLSKVFIRYLQKLNFIKD
jgi:superfamily II DNA/RNA helicase